MHKNTTTFLCKIPLNRIIKNHHNAQKKDKEKNFFVQKQQISKNFPQNEKSLLTKAHRCDIIVS